MMASLETTVTFLALAGLLLQPLVRPARRRGRDAASS
jgi:hypothetical protein